ncbi:SAM-dependent methyltransferase [Clostridium sp. MSJ-4]|uniref:SAM-dependent methyltransferase n=1 Tax=Clostridium simiarum TaxID=2841506 RepID=A0ABS6EZ03_9CLOT|nr:MULTISPECIES: DUF5714 domain-containing protein [Clostridium]MBU5591441.1 SAM-dependent methyltransferase [Clostridium simiarum]
MEHKYNCLICGGNLVYKEKSTEYKCFYCGETHVSQAICENGHYVCDGCHAKGAYDIIQEYCVKSESISPLHIATDLMRHPAIKMHGPEHHFLVPAVLISAYYNAIGKKEDKEGKIKEAAKRSKNVLGGFCGFYGSCGAAVGTGIFMSIITGATPLSKEPWKFSNFVTAKSLNAIAENGGPRCCKRDSFLAIEEASKYLAETLNVNLVNDKVSCSFSQFNPQCIKEECIFYRK